jgi:zinc D-Ala-D-Ala dipeptidase
MLISMKKNSLPSIFILFLFLSGFVACGVIHKKNPANPYNLDLVQSKEIYLQQVAQNPSLKMCDLEEVIDSLYLDIRYATANNFTKSVIYTKPKAYARKPLAEALRLVQDSLAKLGLAIKVYDAYRPYAATLLFYKVYPDTNFVANPRDGSRHNRGGCIDMTLVEKSTGKEIPMPTVFDEFSEKAHPDYANLPDTVLKNRAFLFSIMSHFGFTHYPSEWWHFDYKDWKKYPLMDISFEDLE